MNKNIGIQDKAVSSLADISTATALCLYYSYIIASLPPFTCDLGGVESWKVPILTRFYRRCTTCKLRMLTKGSRGCVPGAPDASTCAKCSSCASVSFTGPKARVCINNRESHCVSLSYPQHLKCMKRGTTPYNNANDPKEERIIKG